MIIYLPINTETNPAKNVPLDFHDAEKDCVVCKHITFYQIAYVGIKLNYLSFSFQQDVKQRVEFLFQLQILSSIEKVFFRLNK